MQKYDILFNTHIKNLNCVIFLKFFFNEREFCIILYKIHNFKYEYPKVSNTLASNFKYERPKVSNTLASNFKYEHQKVSNTLASYNVGQYKKNFIGGMFIF